MQGQTVTWLVPHATSQVLPPDVDYKVMLTFLEFYQSLLQFVNFKLYHAQGLRYPPVLDGKLEAAAAGLEALMHDLAQSGSGGGGAAKALPAAAAPAEAGSGEERGVNPVAEQRIGSLADKVKELEEEIRGERPRANATPAAAPAAAEEEEEGDEAFEIDSGDEGDEGQEEQAGSSDDEEEEEEEEAAADGAPADPTDAELAGAGAGAASSDDEEMQQEEDGERLAGGAADVDADDDAAVCAALFKGLVFFLGREVPREHLLLVVRAFGGEAGWDGEGSPLQEGDERITHQVRGLPDSVLLFVCEG